MMQNPRISDACTEQVTISFCKHMWTLCDIVKRAHTYSKQCKRYRRKTPTANFVIKYERAHTNKKLHGLEARELSAAFDGVFTWWVELKVV